MYQISLPWKSISLTARYTGRFVNRLLLFVIPLTLRKKGSGHPSNVNTLEVLLPMFMINSNSGTNLHE